MVGVKQELRRLGNENQKRFDMTLEIKRVDSSKIKTWSNEEKEMAIDFIERFKSVLDSTIEIFKA